MKQNMKDPIKQKYSAVYKLCVVKYVTLVKHSEQDADFFKALAVCCKRLVQNSRCHSASRILRLKQKGADIKRVHQNFMSDSNKILWRKNLVDAAYSFGYGKLSVNEFSDDNQKNGQKKLSDVLARDELWRFLYEVEKILKKDEEFQVVVGNLKSVFQQYKVPFIENL